MEILPHDELKAILHSYNVDGLSFDDAKQVSPDMTIYFFHDKEKTTYVLLAADYLGGFEDKTLPYNFEFNYGHPYSEITFNAIQSFSYSENAPQKATEYIDDNHLWTKASTGDLCMLFKCSDIKS